MAWLQLVLVALASVTLSACELAGDIFEAGAWVGAIVVILLIAIVGVLVAKIRS
jgi:hypothetical protein